MSHPASNHRHASIAKLGSPLATVPQSDSNSSASSISSRSIRSMTPTPSLHATVDSLSALDLNGLPPHNLAASELTIDSEDYASSPEQYITSVTRRDHPREMSTALSLLASPLWTSDSSKRSTQDSSGYSRFSSISEAATRFMNPRSVSLSTAITTVPANSARLGAKASDVALSTETAGGETARRASVELTGRLMAQAQSGFSTPKSSPAKNQDLSGLQMTPTESLNLDSPTSGIKTFISRSDSNTIVSSLDSATISKTLQSEQPSPFLQTEPPSPPPKTTVDQLLRKAASTSSSTKVETQPDDQLIVLKRGSAPVTTGGISPSKRHALLAAGDTQQLPHVDSKPHIKYEWAVGTRLKYSCTVYYAQQFDSLRNRCGVGEILPQSLAATVDWNAEGGKSRSNFWKTQDNRFIIKTLVNSWNVTDLYVKVIFIYAALRSLIAEISH